MFVQGKITDRLPSDTEALIEPNLDNTILVANPTKKTKKKAKVASLQTIDTVWDSKHAENKEPLCKSTDGGILPLRLRPLLHQFSSNLIEQQCQMLKSVFVATHMFFIEPEGHLRRSDFVKILSIRVTQDISKGLVDVSKQTENDSRTGNKQDTERGFQKNTVISLGEHR